MSAKTRTIFPTTGKTRPDVDRVEKPKQTKSRTGIAPHSLLLTPASFLLEADCGRLCNVQSETTQVRRG